MGTAPRSSRQTRRRRPPCACAIGTLDHQLQFPPAPRTPQATLEAITSCPGFIEMPASATGGPPSSAGRRRSRRIIAHPDHGVAGTVSPPLPDQVHRATRRKHAPARVVAPPGPVRRSSASGDRPAQVMASHSSRRSPVEIDAVPPKNLGPCRRRRTGTSPSRREPRPMTAGRTTPTAARPRLRQAPGPGCHRGVATRSRSRPWSPAPAQAQRHEHARWPAQR